MSELISDNKHSQRQDFFVQEQIERLHKEVEQLKQEKREQQEQIQSLKGKEILLQLVLDNIPQLIFWKDRNSVFQGCNRLWAWAAGLSNPNDVVGKTDDGIYPNATNVEEYLKKDREVIETGIPKFHIEYKPEKDTWYDTKKIPIRSPTGEIVGILATIQDITFWKKAEEVLSQEKEKYREIFTNALEGIFQTTCDGHYLNVNPAMSEIYGYDSPEEMMETITEIGTQIYVDTTRREEFRRLIEEKGEVKKFEYQAYRRDGSIIWVEENTRAVRNPQGKVIFYEGMIQDITKRKKEQEELKRQIEELRVEIDQQKREKEVTRLTESHFFQEVQEEIATVDLDEFWR